MSWGNSTAEIVHVAWKYQDPGEQFYGLGLMIERQFLYYYMRMSFEVK